ncbi:myosin-binding protein 7 [Vigna umbellata]|uniref:myosin-binding protein 7 n=1 Tax=Vigna umbellata TaxID=87088 RepID=UPI001F5E6AA5|nr:myosin-binding protein 7 [Vigna umbellata]
MDLESSRDSVKCCKHCECGCSDCSMVAQSSRNSSRCVKRKHKELERGGKFSVPGPDCDPVARVDIGNECEALRQAVSSQQQSIQDLYAELEEERSAASSAANETMSMILRLQREKAELQMEARQFKRYVEERTVYDQQELLLLEDMLYKKEQAIHSLTCEVQAYKHRLMSLGLTESEAEGDQDEFPPYEYPPLRCKAMHTCADTDNDDIDIDKYAFGETPKDRLRNLESRISQMERSPTYSQVDGEFGAKNIFEKVIVGQSPRWTKHSRKFSCDSSSLCPEYMVDSPSVRKMDSPSQSGDLPNLKKMDNVSEAGDDMIDKVYTIDSEFKTGVNVCDDYASTPRDYVNNADFEDPYVKKLYMRLQALEADRESMRQAIISMRTDKAQLVLLREIAQELCKEMSEQKRMAARSFIGSFSFLTVFKWIASIVFWRKEAHKIKYMFGLPSDSVGLLMLLDKGPHVRSWRYIQRTQVGE